MEDPCPLCLRNGVYSSVSFYQVNYGYALLMCDNNKCLFPFTNEYRSAQWKRNYRDMSKEKVNLVKLKDLIFDNNKSPKESRDLPADASVVSVVECSEKNNDLNDDAISAILAETPDQFFLYDDYQSIYEELLHFCGESSSKTDLDSVVPSRMPISNGECNPNKDQEQVTTDIMSLQIIFDQSEMSTNQNDSTGIPTKDKAQRLEIVDLTDSDLNEMQIMDQLNNDQKIIHVNDQIEETQQEDGCSSIVMEFENDVVDDMNSNELKPSPIDSDNNVSFHIRNSSIMDGDVNENSEMKPLETLNDLNIIDASSFPIVNRFKNTLIVKCNKNIPLPDLDQLEKSGISVEIIRKASTGIPTKDETQSLETVDLTHSDLNEVQIMDQLYDDEQISYVNDQFVEAPSQQHSPVDLTQPLRDDECTDVHSIEKISVSNVELSSVNEDRNIAQSKELPCDLLIQSIPVEDTNERMSNFSSNLNDELNLEQNKLFPCNDFSDSPENESHSEIKLTSSFPKEKEEVFQHTCSFESVISNTEVILEESPIDLTTANSSFEEETCSNDDLKHTKVSEHESKQESQQNCYSTEQETTNISSSPQKVTQIALKRRSLPNEMLQSTAISEPYISRVSDPVASQLKLGSSRKRSTPLTNSCPQLLTGELSLEPTHGGKRANKKCTESKLGDVNAQETSENESEMNHIFQSLIKDLKIIKENKSPKKVVEMNSDSPQNILSLKETLRSTKQRSASQELQLVHSSEEDKVKKAIDEAASLRTEHKEVSKEKGALSSQDTAHRSSMDLRPRSQLFYGHIPETDVFAEKIDEQNILSKTKTSKFKARSSKNLKKEQNYNIKSKNEVHKKKVNQKIVSVSLPSILRNRSTRNNAQGKEKNTDSLPQVLSVTLRPRSWTKTENMDLGKIRKITFTQQRMSSENKTQLKSSLKTNTVNDVTDRVLRKKESASVQDTSQNYKMSLRSRELVSHLINCNIFTNCQGNIGRNSEKRVTLCQRKCVTPSVRSQISHFTATNKLAMKLTAGSSKMTGEKNNNIRPVKKVICRKSPRLRRMEAILKATLTHSQKQSPLDPKQETPTKKVTDRKKRCSVVIHKKEAESQRPVQNITSPKQKHSITLRRTHSAERTFHNGDSLSSTRKSLEKVEPASVQQKEHLKRSCSSTMIHETSMVKGTGSEFCTTLNTDSFNRKEKLALSMKLEHNLKCAPTKASHRVDFPNSTWNKCNIESEGLTKDHTNNGKQNHATPVVGGNRDKKFDTTILQHGETSRNVQDDTQVAVPHVETMECERNIHVADSTTTVGMESTSQSEEARTGIPGAVMMEQNKDTAKSPKGKVTHLEEKISIQDEIGNVRKCKSFKTSKQHLFTLYSKVSKCKRLEKLQNRIHHWKY